MKEVRQGPSDFPGKTTGGSGVPYPVFACMNLCFSRCASVLYAIVRECVFLLLNVLPIFLFDFAAVCFKTRLASSPTRLYCS